MNNYLKNSWPKRQERRLTLFQLKVYKTDKKIRDSEMIQKDYFRES